MTNEQKHKTFTKKDADEWYEYEPGGKPDGWVAWHIKGLLQKTINGPFVCVSEEGALYYLQTSVPYVRETLEEKGYRIRPVKLTYLDEPSNTITMTREELKQALDDAWWERATECGHRVPDSEQEKELFSAWFEQWEKERKV